MINTYTGGALSWSDEDVLIKHVLGVGVFSETTGLGRSHALSVLLGFMLALAMKERVKTIPIPFLNGPSGSRKSAIGIDMGQPEASASGSGAWRADFFVLKDWVDGKLRDRGWNELVCRLSAAMRLLSQAMEKNRPIFQSITA